MKEFIIYFTGALLLSFGTGTAIPLYDIHFWMIIGGAMMMYLSR